MLALPPPGVLAGHVLIGPTQPVCQEGVPCEKPAVGLRLLFLRGAKVVARVTTRSGGVYRVALPAGLYGVRTSRLGPGRGVEPARVAVRSARTRHVDFHVDSGIR